MWNDLNAEKSYLPQSNIISIRHCETIKFLSNIYKVDLKSIDRRTSSQIRERKQILFTFDFLYMNSKICLFVDFFNIFACLYCICI